MSFNHNVLNANMHIHSIKNTLLHNIISLYIYPQPIKDKYHHMCMHGGPLTHKLEAEFDSGDKSDGEGGWEDGEEEPWDGMLVDYDDVDMADAESNYCTITTTSSVTGHRCL